jgi:hypothetical protein
MNPKSIWIIYPSLFIKIFPLCRSFICKKYDTSEYAAWDFIKLSLACWKFILCSGPNLLMKYSYKDYWLILPIPSLEIVFGTHSIIPPIFKSPPVLLEIVLYG